MNGPSSLARSRHTVIGAQCRTTRQELVVLPPLRYSTSAIGRSTFEAERPGGREIDDELELGRLHDRQQIDEVRRLREITRAQLVQRDPTQPLH